MNVFRDNRASIAVETAFIAPVLIFLVIGLVDYALYVMDNMRVAKGVASAVQFAMYNSDNDEGIRQVAFTASKLSSSEATVNIQHSCECPSGNQALVMTIARATIIRRYLSLSRCNIPTRQ